MPDRHDLIRIGVVVGKKEEKSSECEEDIMPVGGKSEEPADLKKYLKMRLALCCASSKLLK
jgi:hypothetical protein